MTIAIVDTATRNAVGDAIINRLAAGSTNATARLIFRNSSNTTLTTNNFSAPPAGSFASGTVTFSAIANSTIAATGTAANFIATNRDNTTIFSGTVGTSGQDINFNTLSFTSGDTCAISSLTMTIPNT
jgi:hypothetical protein